MKRVKASLYGAVAGGITALVLTALFAGRFAVNAIDVLDNRAAFEASSGAMYLLVVVLGLIGGLIIATITHAIAFQAEPDTQRFPASWMLPIGAVVAALFAYAVLRFGVGALVDALSRPSLIGFSGEAAPASTRAMVAEMLQAVGAPVIALIVGAVFAISLSQILLAVEGTGAVVIFSVVGAVVLGGAALIALRPWDRGSAA